MQPVISIITVVYNGEVYLEATMQSVFNQTYPGIEYIVIDGGSTDGTMEIIQRHADRIQYWVSEADKGLYDAMNKGIKAATGDYLWFMNAGDHIRGKDCLERMMQQWTADTDVLYGEVMLVNEARADQGLRSERTTQQLPAKLHWKSLKHGMTVSHQGFLPKRSVAPMYAMGNLSADIGWVIECLKKSKKTTNVGFPIANYLMGGLSKKRHRLSLTDRYQILKKHYGWFQNIFNHIYIIGRAAWNKLLGKSLY